MVLRQGVGRSIALAEEPAAVAAVVNGELTGTEFLLKYCDGKFTSEDLTEEANAFAEKYYGDNGLYLEDYQNHFGEHEYRASESAHDFLRFASILDGRLRTNVLTTDQVKPWWKLW